MFFQLLLYPFCLLKISFSKNGFHKSSLSFENAHKLIVGIYDDYNAKLGDENRKRPLVYDFKRSIRAWIVSFLIGSVLFIVIYFAYITYRIVSYIIDPNLLGVSKFIKFYEFSCYATRVIDNFLILYFICTIILLLSIQYDAFIAYVKRLNEDEEKRLLEHPAIVDDIENRETFRATFDIESLRKFYNSIYENIQTHDQWIRYSVGLFYMTTIPCACCLLYVVMAAESSTDRSIYLQILSLIAVQLTLITITSITLFNKVILIYIYIYSFENQIIKKICILEFRTS